MLVEGVSILRVMMISYDFICKLDEVRVLKICIQLKQIGLKSKEWHSPLHHFLFTDLTSKNTHVLVGTLDPKVKK